MKVDNAIIMAAGTASRFAPLSYERPKALIEVKGEVLIERQIKQLQEAGIKEIIIVTGYKAEQFDYLKDKYGIELIHNPDYLTRNNNASIYVVKDYLKNSYICSSDNYFSKNPFESDVSQAYYAAVYSKGATAEWCMTEDEDGYINSVKIGGHDTWYMLGHVFWDEKFSKKFIDILEKIYDLPESADMLWEKIFIAHLSELKMKIRKYSDDDIFEFDTLNELRKFDPSYIKDTRSEILKRICKSNEWKEENIKNENAFKTSDNAAAGFTFNYADKSYVYNYQTEKLMEEG